MKKRLWISGTVVLVLLLAMATAFVGGRLANGQGLELPNGQLIHFGFEDGKSGSCDVTRIRAPELPGPPMIRRTTLIRRQDQSLYVGIPAQNVVVSSDGTISQLNSFDGPVIEVVVNHETKLYQDVTFHNYTAECGNIQQELKPGSLDDIVDGTTFLLWGERNGDRISASIVVYELPLLTKSGAGR